MVVSSKFAFNWNQHGKLISKCAFNECFKHWKYLMFSFLWSGSWTSYVESTGTSELNWFLNLVLKLPWEHMTHSMISWGSTNLLWPIPKKCLYLLSRYVTCSVKFWMTPSAQTFDKFLLKKNMFFIWQWGGFPLFVCSISQKKSVDLHFLGMTSSLLDFLQSPKWTVSFFNVSSYFTTAVFVFLLMLIICPRWIQCFPRFFTLTQSPTQMHKA